MKKISPKVKTKTSRHTNIKDLYIKKILRKGRHKDKTPTNVLLRKKVIVIILGILTLLDILVLGVGLKFRSKELELETDIYLVSRQLSC